MTELFTVSHLNQLIVDNLHKIRAMPFDIIVHLPRSGTIPASLIATYLCKPLQSIDEFCAGLTVNTRKSLFETLTSILIVDDSINTGVQLKEAVTRIRAVRPDIQIVTLSIYDNAKVQKGRLFNCDLSLYKHSDELYLMPWFLWKTKRISEVAFDMDGVLCRECERHEDDDGEDYINFLNTAEIKFRPLKHNMGAIVTGRLEKYRPQTERWLRKNGFKYNNLIMCPASNKQERKSMNPAIWKAGVYKNLPQKLFVESSAKEALIIAERSEKMVYCIDNSEVYK